MSQYNIPKAFKKPLSVANYVKKAQPVVQAYRHNSMKEQIQGKLPNIAYQKHHSKQTKGMDKIYMENSIVNRMIEEKKQNTKSNFIHNQARTVGSMKKKHIAVQNSNDFSQDNVVMQPHLTQNGFETKKLEPLESIPNIEYQDSQYIAQSNVSQDMVIASSSIVSGFVDHSDQTNIKTLKAPKVQYRIPEKQVHLTNKNTSNNMNTTLNHQDFESAFDRGIQLPRQTQSSCQQHRKNKIYDSNLVQDSQRINKKRTNQNFYQKMYIKDLKPISPLQLKSRTDKRESESVTNTRLMSPGVVSKTQEDFKIETNKSQLSVASNTSLTKNGSPEGKAEILIKSANNDYRKTFNIESQGSIFPNSVYPNPSQKKSGVITLKKDTIQFANKRVYSNNDSSSFVPSVQQKSKIRLQTSQKEVVLRDTIKQGGPKFMNSKKTGNEDIEHLYSNYSLKNFKKFAFTATGAFETNQATLNTEIGPDDQNEGQNLLSRKYEREKSRMLLQQNTNYNQNQYTTYHIDNQDDHQSLSLTFSEALKDLVDICQMQDSIYSESITRASNLLLANNHHLNYSNRGNEKQKLTNTQSVHDNQIYTCHLKNMAKSINKLIQNEENDTVIQYKTRKNQIQRALCQPQAEQTNQKQQALSSAFNQNIQKKRLEEIQDNFGFSTGINLAFGHKKNEYLRKILVQVRNIYHIHIDQEKQFKSKKVDHFEVKIEAMEQSQLSIIAKVRSEGDADQIDEVFYKKAVQKSLEKIKIAEVQEIGPQYRSTQGQGESRDQGVRNKHDSALIAQQSQQIRAQKLHNAYMVNISGKENTLSKKQSQYRSIFEKNVAYFLRTSPQQSPRDEYINLQNLNQTTKEKQHKSRNQTHKEVKEVLQMNETLLNAKVGPKIVEELVEDQPDGFGLKYNSMPFFDANERNLEDKNVDNVSEEGVRRQRISHSMAVPQPSGANHLVKFTQQNKKAAKKIKYNSLSPRDKMFKAIKYSNPQFSLNRSKNLQNSKDSQVLLQNSIERVQNNMMMLQNSQQMIEQLEMLQRNSLSKQGQIGGMKLHSPQVHKNNINSLISLESARSRKFKRESNFQYSKRQSNSKDMKDKSVSKRYQNKQSNQLLSQEGSQGSNQIKSLSTQNKLDDEDEQSKEQHEQLHGLVNDKESKQMILTKFSKLTEEPPSEVTLQTKTNAQMHHNIAYKDINNPSRTTQSFAKLMEKTGQTFVRKTGDQKPQKDQILRTSKNSRREMLIQESRLSQPKPYTNLASGKSSLPEIINKNQDQSKKNKEGLNEIDLQNRGTVNRTQMARHYSILEASQNPVRSSLDQNRISKAIKANHDQIILLQSSKSPLLQKLPEKKGKSSSRNHLTYSQKKNKTEQGSLKTGVGQKSRPAGWPSGLVQTNSIATKNTSSFKRLKSPTLGTKIEQAEELLQASESKSQDLRGDQKMISLLNDFEDSQDLGTSSNIYQNQQSTVGPDSNKWNFPVPQDTPSAFKGDQTHRKLSLSQGRLSNANLKSVGTNEEAKTSDLYSKRRHINRALEWNDADQHIKQSNSRTGNKQFQQSVLESRQSVLKKEEISKKKRFVEPNPYTGSLYMYHQPAGGYTNSKPLSKRFLNKSLQKKPRQSTKQAGARNSFGPNLTPNKDSLTEDDQLLIEHQNISKSHLPSSIGPYGPQRIVKNQALIYKSDIRKVERINQAMDQMNQYFDGHLKNKPGFINAPAVGSKSNKSQPKLAMSNGKNSKFI